MAFAGFQQSFSRRFKERFRRAGLERIFFEVANEIRDSVRVAPWLATVLAGSQSVGGVCLIDKRAVRGKVFQSLR